MTTSDQAIELRTNLKAIGYNTKKVSVKVSYPGYDAKITVTIKDLTADYEAISKLTHQYYYVDRDDRTAEVLNGGNTYINIQYDDKAVAEASKAYTDQANTILSADHREIETIADINGKQLLFIPKYQGVDGFEIVRIQPSDYACNTRRDTRAGYSVGTLSESLMWFNLRQYF